MNAAISWVLAALLINYLIFNLTGYPVLWLTLCYAMKPIGYYFAVVNFLLAMSIVVGGIWSGPATAMKMALALLAINLLPSILQSLIGFGWRCG